MWFTHGRRKEHEPHFKERIRNMEETSMTMSYELITPEIAMSLLENNDNNRSISKGTVLAYANDMLAGNWDERVGEAISIDENGILRNGQHRLSAVVQSGVSIRTWVCRNVSSDGIYDNNRKRSTSDQITIIYPGIEPVYSSTRYIAVARALITHSDKGYKRRTVTPKEIIDFTNAHKSDLDGFFLNIPQGTTSKLSIAIVHLALFVAYMNGIDMEDILNFYDVFISGMSTRPEEFPIIAYRNYLKDCIGTPVTTDGEVARCQYALKKYLTGSCTRRSLSPKELIWEFPYDEVSS